MSNLPTITNEFTKTQIKIIAENSVNEVLESGNVIDVADSISKMELFIKEVKSNKVFVEYLRDEVAKYGKECFTKSGTKIELFEGGVKYNFATCGDIEWETLNAQMESLKTQIAEREKFLRYVPLKGQPIVCKVTGEAYDVYPPSKTSTSTYKVTIGK
jgi:hypothetical protein